MRAAGPATRPPHAFFELGAHPFDMLPPCLGFFDGDGPADPLVAREGRDVFPSRQRPRVGSERLSKIGRKVMDDSSGDSNSCHRFSRRLKDQNLIREYNPDIGAIAGDDAENAGGGILNGRLIPAGNAPLHADGHVSRDRGVARRGCEPVLRVVQADGGAAAISR